MTTIGTVGARLSLAEVTQELGSARVVLEGEEHSSFSDILKDALGEVAVLQNEAQDAIGAFVRGAFPVAMDSEDHRSRRLRRWRLRILCGGPSLARGPM